jgi:hypothetical protein
MGLRHDTLLVQEIERDFGEVLVIGGIQVEVEMKVLALVVELLVLLLVLFLLL